MPPSRSGVTTTEERLKRLNDPDDAFVTQISSYSSSSSSFPAAQRLLRAFLLLKHFALASRLIIRIRLSKIGLNCFKSFSFVIWLNLAAEPRTTTTKKPGLITYNCYFRFRVPLSGSRVIFSLCDLLSLLAACCCCCCYWWILNGAVLFVCSFAWIPLFMFMMLKRRGSLFMRFIR